MKRIDQVLFSLSLALLVSLCGLFARIVVPADASADIQTIELPIVMYHHILKDQSKLNDYTISPEELRSDLQYLKDNGYRSIIMQDLIDYVNGIGVLPEKPVMITFDDGYESFYEYAFPILKEMGFKAVLPVVGTYVDKYSCINDHHICYSHCTWNQLAVLKNSGIVEIQNHSFNLHSIDQGRRGAKKKFGENDSDYRNVFVSDIGKMQDECLKNLNGWLPTTFTYPYGQISTEALPIIKEMGFKAALTCSENINYLSGDPEELYHLARFNRPHGTSFQSLLEKAQSKKR